MGGPGSEVSGVFGDGVLSPPDLLDVSAWSLE